MTRLFICEPVSYIGFTWIVELVWLVEYFVSGLVVCKTRWFDNQNLGFLVFMVWQMTLSTYMIKIWQSKKEKGYIVDSNYTTKPRLNYRNNNKRAPLY